MNSHFDYGNLIVYYFPENGVYTFVDLVYAMGIGDVEVEEGPGAVFKPLHEIFLDGSTLMTLSEFCADLNEELDETNPNYLHFKES